MLLDRRNFFSSLKDNFLENIQETLPFALIKNEVKKTNSEKKDWILIGHIADYPPGAYKEVIDNLVIVSTELGFYVTEKEAYEKKQKKPRYKIKIENNGFISVNSNEFCPEGTVFSLMINDLVEEEE